MIVRNAGATIELITQPDHARLARTIMERCAGLRHHPRRDSILHATGEHDNGWAEVDDSPMVDAETGEILDFIHAPAAVRQGVWPRAVSRLASDPWAAALVAQHALTAYDRFRQDAEWSSFFDEMTATRDEIVSRTDGSATTLLEDYLFVRLGDLISLAFCLGREGEQQFADYSVALSGTNVVVEPDLFDGEAVPLEIQARTLEMRRFESDADLRHALAGSTPVTVRGEVRRAGLASR